MTNRPMKQLLAAALILTVGTTTQAKILEYRIEDGDTTQVETIGRRSIRFTHRPKGSMRVPNYSYLKEDTYQGESVFDTIDPHVAIKSITFGAQPSADGNEWDVRAKIHPQGDEWVYGTGQFQDGYLDAKGLTRRLTQVNTQISVPVIISSAGYGIVWNNNGLTRLNPGTDTVKLIPIEQASEVTQVDVTTTTGNARETRSSATYVAEIDLPTDGQYALLLDCGQTMSRRHYLEIDGQVLTRADNLWLPPTTSAKAWLSKGKHQVLVKGDTNDTPTLEYRHIDDTTTIESTGAQAIDLTLILGTPDEIIAEIRQLTGQVPMLPKWALGYIHCRERYDTQAELLANAKEFRERGIPIDIIVQDWQWWGDNGWNAMKFDTKKYPDPKAMTDSLHTMDMRIMLSVWAKIDKNSDLGKEMEAEGHYIPGTDWIDFFNSEAAEAYWKAYRDNLLPTGIDAWWQDATEPENDDLHGRTVDNGRLSGDAVRNVYPIAVNDRVYRGLCEERPDTRPMILTRSAATGIQRYGVVTWSGDVGNDWQTLDRQIKGGLSQMATGVPWWTYDSGGFFRPGDQYTDSAYQKRMLRWIQNSVFLPMMRVHGYMSKTEPWHYSSETYQHYVESIRLRYNLIPYIYSEAARVSQQGSTLMRPLVFDYYDDPKALGDNSQYMFGPSLLICPITSPAATMDVYLPKATGGWYDIFNNQHYNAGEHTITLADTHIPVFAKAGTILPWHEDTEHLRSTTDVTNAESLTIRVYPGADGQWTHYDDDGISQQYRKGAYTSIPMRWNDDEGILVIGTPEGTYRTPIRSYKIVLPDGTQTTVENTNNQMTIKLKP